MADPPCGDLFYPGIEITSPASLILADGFFTTEPPRKPQNILSVLLFHFYIASLIPVSYDSWIKTFLHIPIFAVLL